MNLQLRVPSLTLAALFLMNVVASASLMINELDSDQVNTPSTDPREFIEIYESTGTSVPLDGYALVFWNGNGDISYLALDLDGKSTDSNGYFVAGNPLVIGAVTANNIQFNTNTLQNGPDAVGLYTGNASDFPNGTALTITNLIDAVTYDTNDADDTELAALLVAGGQVNEDANDSTTESIGRFPNGSGAARDTTTWTTMTPTPGGPNSGNVPEPATILLLSAAGAFFIGARRR
jgi:hypothetical protein